MQPDFSKVQFHPQWQQMVAPPKAPPVPAKQKGKGGFLSSIISELSGAGGAAGGAAIGTALLPGVGTIIGGGIGGLLGGFGGKAVEQKVRDDQNVFGKGGSFKKDLGEGALSGALSAGGEAFSALKGARQAGVGLKEALSPAGARAFAEAGGRTGVVEGVGKGLETGGLGVAQGAAAPGVEALGAKQSDQILQTIKDLGLKTGSPEAVQRALEPKLTKLGESLTQKYAANNVKLTTEEVNKLGTTILDKALSKGGISGSAAKEFALEESQKIAKVKDVSGLWQYAKDLDESLNFNRASGAAVPGHEAIGKIIRGEVRPLLEKKVEGVAADNALYHNALDANKLLIKASKNTGGGVVDRVAGLGPVKATEAKAGAGLQDIGKLLAGTGGPVSKVTNNLIRQAPGGLSRALGGAAQPLDPTQGVTSPVEPPQDFSQTDLGQVPNQAPQEQPQQTYSLQNALQDAQRDPKNASQYLAYAKAFEDQASSQGTSGQPNITKVTAQQYGLAQRGSQSLNQLANLLQNDPNVLSRSATPGRKLPIVGGFISNAAKTGDFDAIGYNVASALLRLETGAQANESEIKNLQSQLMPRAGDDQQTVARKLQQLNQAFNTYLNSAGVPEQGALAGALM